MSKTKVQSKESKQKQSPNMNKLISKLKHLPFEADEYQKEWEKLQPHIKEKYGKEYALCVDMESYAGVEFVKDTIHQIINMNDVNDPRVNTFNLPYHPSITPGITFVKRDVCEYNPRYRQLSAFTFIHDGTHALVLKRKGNNRRKYALPGGHTDFIPGCGYMPLLKILRKNAVKEILEEVNISKTKITKQQCDRLIRPLFYIDKPTDWNKTFHSAMVFELFVPNIKTIMEGVTSGEPTKHDVEIIDINNFEEHTSKCSWLSACIQHAKKSQFNIKRK